MKSLLLLITIVILFAHNGIAQSNIPHFIKVTYVAYSIETFFEISCNYFDNAFSKDEYKFHQIKTNSELVILGNTLQDFVKTKSNGIDVRGKIEYILHGRKFKYCFNKFGVFSDGINYYKNNNLVRSLKQKFSDLFP